MKSRFILLCIFFYSLHFYAQSSTSKALEKFTAVKVYDRINVTLIKGDENKIVLTGKDKDEVNITENDGLLKIKMKLNQLLSGNTVNASLYYTETLTLIDVNENAKLTTINILEGNEIEIKAQEAGVIKLQLNVKQATVKSTTGSEISLNGSAFTQEVNASMGGMVYNNELITEETTVTVLAGGHAKVYCDEKVVAKVKAGGSIHIYGQPRTVVKDDTFGGEIKVIID